MLPTDEQLLLLPLSTAPPLLLMNFDWNDYSLQLSTMKLYGKRNSRCLREWLWRNYRSRLCPCSCRIGKKPWYNSNWFLVWLSFSCCYYQQWNCCCSIIFTVCIAIETLYWRRITLQVDSKCRRDGLSSSKFHVQFGKTGLAQKSIAKLGRGAQVEVRWRQDQRWRQQESLSPSRSRFLPV